MNILFYVEPLIENSMPYWKDGWADVHARQFKRTLEAGSSRGEHSFCIVMNEPVAERFRREKNLRTVVMTQGELLKPFESGPLGIAIDWFRGSYSSEQLDYYCRLYKDKLDGFVPDVIITSTRVPFLEKLFPDSLVIHREYAMFSRFPYPETWFLDPIGLFSAPFFSRYQEHIEQAMPMNGHRQQLVDSYKSTCQSVLRQYCPFSDLMDEFRQRYSQVLLLPLQFSEYYLFDGVCEYASQFEFFLDVVENTPPDVGIVVSRHPQERAFSHDLIRYIESRYPNVLISNHIDKYSAPSEYLAAYADCIVTVSSKVGYLPLLWDNKVISLGEDYLNFMADGTSLSQVSDVLAAESRNRDQLLYWIMTHYAIPADYLHSPQWLADFLDHGLNLFRSGDSLHTFYQPIDDDAELFKFHELALQRRKPEYKSVAITRGTRSEDDPQKFAAEEFRKTPFLELTGLPTYQFDLPAAAIKRIRIDPTNTAAEVMLVQLVLETDQGQETYPVTNPDRVELNDQLHFLNEYADFGLYKSTGADPYLLLSGLQNIDLTGHSHAKLSLQMLVSAGEFVDLHLDMGDGFSKETMQRQYHHHTLAHNALALQKFATGPNQQDVHYLTAMTYLPELHKRLYDLGQELYKNGDLRGAVYILQLVTRFAHGPARNPNVYFHSCHLLASIFSSQGKLEYAIKEYEKIIEAADKLVPGNIRTSALYHMGDLLSREGEVEKAKTCLQECLERNPGFAAARSLLDRL